MALYLIQNGAVGTTAAPVSVTTGTAIKTMLQFKPSATLTAKIVEWGISFDGSAAATPGKIELMESDVAATVTATALADITKYDGDALANGDPTTNLIQIGTSATGYTASAEGTTTVSRVFDLQLLPPTGPYVKQFPLGREPVLQVAKFARIRVTFGTAINAYCYMIVSI
jgi:FlaG/FlaF family flagellin (archaellin)